MEAVKQNGLALQFVEKQNDEICFAAITENRSAVNFVKKIDKYVTVEHNDYTDDDFAYVTFLRECTKGSDTCMNINNLYEHFKNWFKENNKLCHYCVPCKQVFMREIMRYKTIEKKKIRDSSGKTVSIQYVMNTRLIEDYDDDDE